VFQWVKYGELVMTVEIVLALTLICVGGFGGGLLYLTDRSRNSWPD
jgi:hypothetical protein